MDERKGGNCLSEGGSTGNEVTEEKKGFLKKGAEKAAEWTRSMPSRCQI